MGKFCGEKKLKFVADSMLGKLTRWLRMMGYNVKYSSSLDDDQLLTIAKKERRALLTRDLELYQRATAKNVNALYIEGTSEVEELAQLAKRFEIPLGIDLTVSRCPKCNTRVKPVPKESIGDKVKETTFEFYNEFWQCPKCGQVYWRGAHWKRIRKTLEEAEERVKKRSG